ncbi:MAG: L,D-transpeptidase [Chloroflexota bacterium]|nr:MAG: L,D-transpeptidase [Chloroflexota bacterium]
MVNRILLLNIFLLLTLFTLPISASAQEADYESSNSAGEILCLPGDVYQSGNGCAMLGPSAYLSRMQHLGISFPLQPLNGKNPDPALTYVDIRYGEVVRQNAPVYASLEDAVKKGSVVRKIDSPYSFISYTDEAVIDGKRYYMVDYGGWMTANDISRIGTPSLFQGKLFSYTPERPFGWIIFPTETKQTPGFDIEDYTGREVYRYQEVQIYATETIDGIEWYMIGPDEWIPENREWQRLIGRVLPNPNPPDGVNNGRWIEVNLKDQTVAVYDQGQLVFASLIASGIEPFWTRPGLFQIYEKYDSTPMRGAFEADRSDAYYLEDVPWTMYYDKARALHGAYWHNGFGAPRSHGCVNMSVGDARWLYDWADIGDWVYVWDPSGRTPTDPEQYGDGGA